jgi:hypothetical protein
MRKNVIEGYKSIFPDRKKSNIQPKKKESNNLNYYKNFLNNTENIFVKSDGNGSKSQRGKKEKDFFENQSDKKGAISNFSNLSKFELAGKIIR